MNKTELRSLLFSSQLLITSEGYAAEMMRLLPIPNQTDTATITPKSFFFGESKTYQQESVEALSALKKELRKSELKDVNLTMDYENQDIDSGSVAYHRVFGFITSSSNWYFSSKQFEKDLMDAEMNDNIISHLIHVNSPGGEAYYLDRLSETMHTLTKPVVVLIEKYCASAAYYIGCHSQHIYALTLNDIIGCIGTMVSVCDFSGYYEKLGIKVFDVHSSKSPLKNKMYDDLEKGNVDEYRTRVLDPLAIQFINEVRLSRPSLSKLEDSDPLFEGDTFSTDEAIAKGVIDGRKTLTEAVLEAATLGQSQQKLKSFAFNNL